MCSVGVFIRFKALSLPASCTSYCDYRKEQPIVSLPKTGLNLSGSVYQPVGHVLLVDLGGRLGGT
jgi:hypothetical protein